MSELNQIVNYISTIFGEVTTSKIIGISKSLPYYFSSEYQVVEVKIMGMKFLLLIDLEERMLQYKQIKKRVALLEEYSDGDYPIVYCSCSMTWYLRDKLLRDNMSFVVPNQQLYIPFLGAMFSEKYSEKKKAIKSFSPSTQYLVFNLLSYDNKPFRLNELNYLGLSKMSVSRSLNDLHRLGIVEKKSDGKSIDWTLSYTGSNLWKEIEPFLFNPIQSREYVINFRESMILIQENMTISGESALSELSMLGLPTNKSYAVSSKKWLEIKNDFQCVDYLSDDHIVVEVWKHDVPLLGNHIHPLALKLSLMDLADERIQMSIDEVLDAFGWEVK